MNRFHRGIVIGSLFLQASLAVQPEGRSRFTAQKNEYVPDERTAITIAEAVLLPIYGRQLIASEQPFQAHLEGALWIVTGTLHTGLGGVATVKLQRSDGRIVSVLHGK